MRAHGRAARAVDRQRPRAAHARALGRDACRGSCACMPHDYRRVVEAQARMREKGLSPEEAEMAAFEENARDAARASSGN